MLWTGIRRAPVKISAHNAFISVHHIFAAARGKFPQCAANSLGCAANSLSVRQIPSGRGRSASETLHTRLRARQIIVLRIATVAWRVASSLCASDRRSIRARFVA